MCPLATGAKKKTGLDRVKNGRSDSAKAHYAVTPVWEPTNIQTLRRKERRIEEN